MQTGCLYFVTDEFYEKFDKEKTLMQNKETIDGISHNRPCFFAFQDKKNNEIYWLVPLSSRVEKYEAIVQQKINKMIAQGKNAPICNTIRFGEVMGYKKAFLIQNIFPITQKYISNIYVDKNTKNNLTLSTDLVDDIIKNANQVLKLHSRGIKLTFGNIDKIYYELCDELTHNLHQTKQSGKDLDINSLEQIMKHTEKSDEVIARTNAILNENPNLKRAFIEAKKNYIERKDTGLIKDNEDLGLSKKTNSKLKK